MPIFKVKFKIEPEVEVEAEDEDSAYENALWDLGSCSSWLEGAEAEIKEVKEGK